MSKKTKPPSLKKYMVVIKDDHLTPAKIKKIRKSLEKLGAVVLAEYLLVGCLGISADPSKVSEMGKIKGVDCIEPERFCRAI